MILVILLLRRRHSQFAYFLSRRSVGKRWLSVDRLVVSVFLLSTSRSIRPEGHPRLVHTESDYPVDATLFREASGRCCLWRKYFGKHALLRLLKSLCGVIVTHFRSYCIKAFERNTRL
jgi:hypothetical protein